MIEMEVSKFLAKYLPLIDRAGWLCQYLPICLNALMFDQLIFECTHVFVCLFVFISIKMVNLSTICLTELGTISSLRWLYMSSLVHSVMTLY